MAIRHSLDRFRGTADSIRASNERDALAAIESCEELDFLVLLDQLSVCDLYSTLAGRQTLSFCHVAAGEGSAAKFVLGTRLGLVKRLVILFVILVLSFRLHLLGVGFALALVATGCMVIRHVRRHDEFFEELDSFPGSDAPSYFVDQIIVVLAAFASQCHSTQ